MQTTSGPGLSTPPPLRPRAPTGTRALPPPGVQLRGKGSAYFKEGDCIGASPGGLVLP